MGMSVTFQQIQEAAKRIEGHVIHSPCPLSITLSEATGLKVFCKLEYLQRTGSFKERGLASDGRLYRFRAAISDRPGGLARFVGLIAEAGASIIEIAHDRAGAGEDITTVNVHCIIETRDADHIHIVHERLDREGFRVCPT